MNVSGRSGECEVVSLSARVCRGSLQMQERRKVQVEDNSRVSSSKKLMRRERGDAGIYVEGGE
jgi:hypothetical protein